MFYCNYFFNLVFVFLSYVFNLSCNDQRDYAVKTVDLLIVLFN